MFGLVWFLFNVPVNNFQSCGDGAGSSWVITNTLKSSMTLHGGRGVRTLDLSLLRLRHERLILHITSYENAEYSNVHMT